MKCDETKPLCKRCTSTGRHCEGYAAQPPSAQDNYFDLLLQSQRPPHPFGAVTSKDEGRALQYFHAAASPLMVGANDASFWTKVVMQFTHFEPAVRHSVVAIGLLHEQIHKSKELGVAMPALTDEYLPLKHYNLAIRELKGMDAVEKRPIVLFACVLFICIEIMQSNREVALQHCKHGLAILEHCVYHYPWTQEHLIPLFRKLSMCLYYFDDDTSPYSVLDAFAGPQYERFESFNDAQHQMDEIFRRMLRLVKRGAAYRGKNTLDQPLPQHLLIEQEAVDVRLDDWNRLFTAYDDHLLMMTTSPLMKIHDLNNQFLLNMKRKHLLTMYEVCRVWNTMAFATDELGYDDFMDVFEGMVGYLQNIDTSPTSDPDAENRVLRFVFEMGFQPTIYFLTTKCRDIKTRLEAMSFIKKFGVPRESLWDSMHTFHICRRIIEIEHDVALDAQGKPLTQLPDTPPHDSMRVRDAWTISHRCKRMRKGELVPGRLICFLLPTPDGGTKKVTEFLCEDTTYLEEDVSLRSIPPSTSGFD